MKPKGTILAFASIVLTFCFVLFLSRINISENGATAAGATDTHTTTFQVDCEPIDSQIQADDLIEVTITSDPTPPGEMFDLSRVYYEVESSGMLNEGVLDFSVKPDSGGTIEPPVVSFQHRKLFMDYQCYTGDGVQETGWSAGDTNRSDMVDVFVGPKSDDSVGGAEQVDSATAADPVIIAACENSLHGDIYHDEDDNGVVALSPWYHLLIRLFGEDTSPQVQRERIRNRARWTLCEEI